MTKESITIVNENVSHLNYQWLGKNVDQLLAARSLLVICTHGEHVTSSRQLDGSP